MNNINNDLYELHWNNHTKLLKRTFDSFRNDNDLIDVTLSCEGKQLKAHKIILSACSLYFLELFKENPCQHPIVILRDIKYQVMVDILNFMYVGEVNISMENLNSFLKTAEYLQVKGLTEELIKSYSNIPDKINQLHQQCDTYDQKNENIDHNIGMKENIYNKNKLEFSNQPLPSTSSLKTTDTIKCTQITELERHINQNIFKEETEELKTEVIDLEDLTNESDENIEYPEQNVGQNCSIEQLAILANMPSSKRYPCPNCDKVFTHRVSLKLHMPKHTGSTQCTFCSAVLCRRYELKKHMRKVHNIEMDLSLFQ